MTVEAMPLVAENTIGAVSADHGTRPRRSDHPVQTSTTDSPSRYTASAPPPNRRPGNMLAKLRTAQAKGGSAAPRTPLGSIDRRLPTTSSFIPSNLPTASANNFEVILPLA